MLERTALIDDEANVLFINPIAEDFDRGVTLVRDDHKTLDVNVFRYGWGSYYQASIPLDFVYSADAYQLSLWWENRTNLALYEGTSAGFIGNLLENGNLENTSSLAINFSLFYGVDTVVPFSSDLYLVNSAGVSGRRSDDFITVDIGKSYKVAASIRSINSGTNVYAGFYCYDGNFNQLETEHVYRVQSTETTLFDATSDGSSYINIVPPPNSWYSGKALGTYVQFGVKQDFTDLPNFSAKIIYVFSTDTTISTSYHRVYVVGGVDSAYPAGEPVAISGGGLSYLYCVSSAFDNRTPNSAWFHTISSLSGVNSYYEDPDYAYTKFFRGTKYVKFAAFHGINASFYTYYDDIVLEQVPDLKITNSTRPLSRVSNGQIDYWHGTIELESF